ncbi:AAA family ATPase [Mycobacteroides abscessus]|uniref:AAA family ATPase n=1 Tax=Mycobacteroides abscessus TaxID=36809 RepID=UPI0009A63E7A|nr:AAA family ATPase [Mycobacteroides abscessus]SKO15806.1 type VII secretion AAA-ATPase EccA [Mycobacteroides abscessus subsp. bolletii]SKX37169.1 type VII secretion AAA-ATPase EccA [Mycobacteroides abscessus subsp. bolletii]
MASEAAADFAAAIKDRTSDPGTARKVFAMATDADPTMADAWLGRIGTGDKSLAAYAKVSQHADKIGVACRTLGRHPRDLEARFPAGDYLNLPLHDAESAHMGYAAALIRTKQFDKAREILASQPTTELTKFMRAVLGAATERWTDVIAALGDPDSINEPTGVAYLMAARASAALGLSDAALKYIATAKSSLNSAVVRDAKYFEALVRRHIEEEDAAKKILIELVASFPNFAEARTALDDTDFRLIVTDPATIDSRTVWWDPTTSIDKNVVAAETADADRQQLLDETDAFMARQVGLTAVKEEWALIKDRVLFNAARKSAKLKPLQRTNHMVFYGPPGSGKTSVAVNGANYFHAAGILPTNKVVKRKAFELIGKYIGHTEDLTAAAVEEAKGGVLTIDEAPALVSRGGENDFGPVVLQTLVPYLEDERQDLVVMLMGYEDEMQDLFLVDPGLDGRFPVKLWFPSYTASELVQISGVFGEDFELSVDAQAEDFLGRACEQLVKYSHLYEPTKQVPKPRERRMIDHLGNARYIRNLMEKSGDGIQGRWKIAHHRGETINLQEIIIGDMEAAVYSRTLPEFHHVLPPPVSELGQLVASTRRDRGNR